jgi:hypothetical protein
MPLGILPQVSCSRKYAILKCLAYTPLYSYIRMAYYEWHTSSSVLLSLRLPSLTTILLLGRLFFSGGATLYFFFLLLTLQLFSRFCTRTISSKASKLKTVYVCIHIGEGSGGLLGAHTYTHTYTHTHTHTHVYRRRFRRPPRRSKCAWYTSATSSAPRCATRFFFILLLQFFF